MLEIYKLDPLFADPEGLSATAQQKLEDEKRKVKQADKLDEMYSEAVQLTQAGEFQQALAKWDQIRSMDANYNDSDNVYAKATRGLEAVPSPPKPTTSRLTFPTLGIEWSLVLITYGWLITGLIMAPLAAAPLPEFASFTLLSLVGGVLSGTILWFALRISLPSLNSMHLVGLILGWAIGLVLGWVIESIIFLNVPLYVYSLHALGGAVGGLVTALMISRATPEIPKARLVIITIGWAAGLLIGDMVASTLLELSFSNIIPMAVRSCVAGLIGGWVTLEAIRKGPLQRPDWLEVGVSIPGFIIAMVLADLIFNDAYDNNNLLLSLLGIAVWGLVGGAALGIPSRNLRKIALLGGAGAVGMLSGALIWDALNGVHDSILYNLDVLHWKSDINLFLGLGLGLILGLTTRRAASALILAIVGAAAFMLSAWLIQFLVGWGDFSLLVDIVAGATIGGILGLARGYLEELKT
jgi:hypothetical protein